MLVTYIAGLVCSFLKNIGSANKSFNVVWLLVDDMVSFVYDILSKVLFVVFDPQELHVVAGHDGRHLVDVPVAFDLITLLDAFL
jgi:hypothetical protein